MNDEVRIDYNAQMKRFSLSRNDDWLSFTHTSFRVMMVMMDETNEYDRIVVNQLSSQLEIIKNFKNFMLEFKCKNFTSVIVMCESTMKALYNASNGIWKNVNSLKTIKVNASKNDITKKTLSKKSILINNVNNNKRKRDTLVVNPHESNKMKIVSNNEYTNDTIKDGGDAQIDTGE